MTDKIVVKSCFNTDAPSFDVQYTLQRLKGQKEELVAAEKTVMEAILVMMKPEFVNRIVLPTSSGDDELDDLLTFRREIMNDIATLDEKIKRLVRGSETEQHYQQIRQKSRSEEENNVISQTVQSSCARI